jgi:hypothetical protein
MTENEQVARAALSHLYEPGLVATLRSDSPLPGFRSADAIAVSVAVAAEGMARGREVVLSDEQMVSIRTLGDLIVEIAAHSTRDADE